MHSRRNFIEGLAAGVAATALSSSRVLGANERIRLGIIGPGARGKELMRFALACPNTEIVGAADVYTRRLEEARKLAPNAKTYLDYRHLLEDNEHRRRPDCHAAASALRAFRRVARRRQACLPGEDHGLHRGSRQAHARGLPAGRQADRADRPSGMLDGPDRGCRRVHGNRLRRQDHVDSRAHVSQHAARQAAVDAAHPSRHDRREHHLEIVPGRGRAARVRSQPLHQLAVLLGLFGRQLLREHVPPAGHLVQGARTCGSPRR